MFKFIAILFCFSAIPAMAGVGENVCEQIFPKEFQSVQNQPLEPAHKKKVSSFDLIKLVGKIIFAPSTLVQMNKIENQMIGYQDANSLKMAFLNPKEVAFSAEEKALYQSYKNSQSDIQKTLKSIGFRDGIRKSHNLEECVTFTKSNPIIEIKLQQLQDLIEKNQDLMAKFQEQNVSKEVDSMLHFLKRNHWVIIRGKNLNEIHSLIKAQKPSSVLMLSHSSPEGKLFDGESNVFPTSYFESLKGIVDNLIVFSCYSAEVIENYKMNDLANNMNYFYPLPGETTELLLGKTTPIIALKSIKKINLEKAERVGNEDSKTCTFDLHENLPSDFTLFLNGKYLSSGEKEISFDCNLLLQKNRVEIYSTVKTSFTGKLNISEILLNSKYIIKLDEFSSQTTNRHIVTKGSFTNIGEIHEAF